MIVCFVSGIIALYAKNGQNGPGRYEERDEEYARGFKGLDLGDAETAIVMLPPVVMVMEGKQGAKIEAEE